MKKILLFAVMLVSYSSVFGQAQKTIFIEEFTQASCTPCETTTPALNAILNSNADKLVQLRYQTSWPGVDPMNADNPGDVQARVNYYGVTGVPNVRIDGADSGSPGTVTQAQLDAASMASSMVSVAVEHELSADLSTMNVTVSITNEAAADYDMSTDNLRVAVMEEDITWPTPPGSTSLVVFDAVMKAFVTGVGGMDLPTIAAGETWTMTWEDFALPARIYDYNKLAVVAFIQDEASKNVINANASEPIELTGYADVAVSSDANVEGGLCEFGYIGSATITNDGGVAVNDYTVALILNGTVAQTIQVTDELPIGGSNVVMFDEVTLGAGTSNINYAVNVAAGDIATLNNATPAIIAGKAGDIVTMVEKDYENEILGALPSGAIVDRPITNLNFIVVDAAGLGATFPMGGYGESDNTVMINFWQWNPGGGTPANGSMIVGERFVAEDNSRLTLDYAYTSYASSNDRMQIQVSTDCGETFEDVFNDSGPSLATAPEVNLGNQFFVPTSADHWRTLDIDLAAYAGETILVRVYVTSAWGDMLYIDNVNMMNVTDVNELAETETFEVYPNPASNLLTLDLNVEAASNVQLRMVDMMGRTVKNQSIGTNVTGALNYTLDVSDIDNGAYLVYINVDEKAVVKRVTVAH